MRGLRHYCCVASLVLALLLSSLAAAIEPRGAAQVTVTALDEPAPALIATAGEDLAALDAHVGGLARATLAHAQVAGLIIAVVRGGEVLHLSGHGIANADGQAPDPERSLFRVGSISKTFTYVALMQLVDAGQLALEDPVNQHLPEALQLPDAGYAEPLRIRHLLSHTGGFEDSALGHLFVRDPAQMLTPEAYLLQHRPARVRAPGVVAVYSNYGVALLGAVIAHRSGRSYIEQVETALLSPLAMQHASFREPLPEGHVASLPAPLRADVASGFRRVDGRFVAGEFEHVAHGAAAGGLSATAADMARWMRMLLKGGELRGVRVLSEASTRLLAKPLHYNAPGVAPVAHGFLTGQYETAPGFGHGGATLLFHSAMELLPEQRLGVFVSANSDNARVPVAKLARLIIEFLHPELAPAPLAAVTIAREDAPLAGQYRSNRRHFSSAEKLFTSVGAAVELKVQTDGSLLLQRASGVTRYLPLGGGRYREAEGHGRLQVLGDAPSSRFVTDPGVAVFERVGVWESHTLLLLTLLAAAGISILRLVTAGWRWWRLDRLPDGLGRLRLGVGLLWLTALTAFGLALADAAAQGSLLVYSYPGGLLSGAMRLLQGAALLTLVELVWTLLAWKPLAHWQPRSIALISSALLLLAVAQLAEWRLLG